MVSNNCLRSMSSPLEPAAVYHVDLFVFQPLTQGRCLFTAQFRERRILLALITVDSVPLTLAMADNDQSQRCSSLNTE